MVSIEEITESISIEESEGAVTRVNMEILKEIDLKREAIQNMDKTLNAPGMENYFRNLGVIDIRVLKKEKERGDSYWGIFTTVVELPEEAYRKDSSEHYTPEELVNLFPGKRPNLVNNERQYKRVQKRIEREVTGRLNSAELKDFDTRIKRFIIITEDYVSIEKIIGVSVVNFNSQLRLRRLILNAKEREGKKQFLHL